MVPPPQFQADPREEWDEGKMKANQWEEGV
jgi:hypothetical protein